MYKKLIVLALFSIVMVTFTGCVTTADVNKAKANYNNYVDQYIGMNEHELLSSWGAPDESYVSGDGKYRFLTYDTQYKGSNTTKGLTEVKNGDPDEILEPGKCRTIFKLENDKVISYETRGKCYILD